MKRIIIHDDITINCTNILDIRDYVKYRIDNKDLYIVKNSYHNYHRYTKLSYYTIVAYIGIDYDKNENIIFNNEEQTARNEAFYDSILNKMLDLLEKMDENNYDYKELDDFKEIYEKQEEAKNKFFELFSKIFYALWD